MYKIIDLDDVYQIFIKKEAVLLNTAKELLNEIEKNKGYDCYNISVFPTREEYYINPINLEARNVSKVAFIIKKDLALKIKNNEYTSQFISKDIEAQLLKSDKKIKCLYNINVKFTIEDNLNFYI